VPVIYAICVPGYPHQGENGEEFLGRTRGSEHTQMFQGLKLARSHMVT
jgi:hypothetical protein